MTAAVSASPAIEPGALDRLLALCDTGTRRALCQQLIDDFRRLQDAIGDECSRSTSRAAHELKGLAATVGALRLAEIATTLDQRAEAMDASTRALVVAQVRRELAAVLWQIEAAGRALEGS